MRILTSEIEIAASADAVWQVLTDFAAYPDWNPVEIRMAGQPVAGTVLEHTSKLPGRKPMTFRPTIVEAQPGRVLAWEARLAVPGLFGVHHRFEIEAQPGQRARLRQEERFRGALVPFCGRALRQTQAAFEIANQAIKRRVESRPGASAGHPAAGPAAPGQR